MRYKFILLLLSAFCLHIAVLAQPKGYLVSVDELLVLKQKAEKGQEPYKTNYDRFMRFVGASDKWEYGTLDGEVILTGSSSSHPPQLSMEAAKLVFAKAIAYQMTSVPVAQLPQRYAIILKNIDIRLFIT